MGAAATTPSTDAATAGSLLSSSLILGEREEQRARMLPLLTSIERRRFRLEGVESGRKGCEIERYGRQAGVVLTENTDTTAIRYGKNHFFLVVTY